FTPLNQDKGAWYRAEDAYRAATGRDLSGDLADEKYWPQIAANLNKIWISLPGGGLGAMSQEQFNQRLRDATARYRDPYPDD
ncbi:MAG: hypothetical protein JSS35_20180, partial [Proteobacteria bacterium]|nr:hypothetical protein [Pseudomonadota bacterium]